MRDLGIFGQELKKKIVMFEINIWAPNVLDLDIFGLEFENNFVISEINILKFVQLQSFPEKQKCLNLGPTMLF